MIKRLIRNFVVCLLCCSLLMAYATSAFATPETHPNTYTNTGNQRADVIGVALTQVGYREGANNDTKYSVWYGLNNVGWCGIFVAWCANQASVPTSVLRRTGVASPDAFGVAVKPADYIPIGGDLFFAKDYSHVGFVYYVEGEYFYSIEGNTYEGGPEGVYIRKHKISNVVFASPNYQGGGNHKYEKKVEDAHPHSVYYVCVDCGSSYKTGATTTLDTCLECKQANCSHSYSKWADYTQDTHKRSCSLCGKEESKNHNWNKETIVTSPTCNAAGSKNVTCSDCGTNKTVSVPSTGKHDYTAWSKVDENSHQRSCKNCSKKEIKAHTVGGDWSSNDFEHWHGCSLCGEKFSTAEHKFGEACDSPCEICKYVSPEGHHYSAKWTTDDKMHWRVCSGCEVKGSEGEHAFDSGCDRICDGCGFERDVDHIFADTLSYDGFAHWTECTVCGLRKDSEDHVVDSDVREGAMISCNICEAQLTSEEDHIHGFDQVESDDTNHWGICSCGMVMEKESHKWSMRSGKCSVCSAAHIEVQTDDFEELLPWFYIGGGTVLISIALLVVLILIRKRKN